jgi:N6-L-threonylcarbamoyladenine synthase
MGRLTLGIESSCDEIAAALYEEGRGVLSNHLFSQIELHRKFGGVVPEIASRSHLEKISLIVEQALTYAQVTLDTVDIIAVTNKPGLPGSLLIGLCFAKALAYAQKKPLIGINHLEGHIFSSFLSNDVPFPHLCLTASGGHTALYLVNNFGDVELLGQTIDDAAGEAFDKIAKLINLPYPGGPIIEKLAFKAHFADFFHYPRNKPKTLDFSFSGLKTAVFYDLVNKGLCDLKTKKYTPALEHNASIKEQVASSLLVCITDIFKQKLNLALEQYPWVKAVTFVGGVACNKFIRQQLQELGNQKGLPLMVPAPQFCTDNGAMIALVGNYKAAQGKFSNLTLDIFK